MLLKEIILENWYLLVVPAQASGTFLTLLGPSERNNDMYWIPSCKMSTEFSSPVLLQQNESSEFCSSAQPKGQNHHRTLSCVTDSRKARCMEKFSSIDGKTKSLCHSIDTSNRSLDELYDGMKTSLVNDESKKRATPAAMLTTIEKTVFERSRNHCPRMFSLKRKTKDGIVKRTAKP